MNHSGFIEFYDYSDFKGFRRDPRTIALGSKVRLSKHLADGTYENLSDLQAEKLCKVAMDHGGMLTELIVVDKYFSKYEPGKQYLYSESRDYLIVKFLEQSVSPNGERDVRDNYALKVVKVLHSDYNAKVGEIFSVSSSRSYSYPIWHIRPLDEAKILFPE